jgi:hypothetical protein
MKHLTYALLIYRTGPEALPAASERKALEGHRAVQAAAAARGELHAVAKLSDAPKARTVTKRGSSHAVSDGPYIETKEWLVGFYLVDCVSEEEAVERAKLLCPLDGHAIEVRPVEWRWKE